MHNYQHKVTGIYASREQAELTLTHLLEHQLQRERLQIIEPHDATSEVETSASSDHVLKDVLVDSAIGTAIGTGAGALGAAAFAAANISLFIASPLLGPLVMMGWGAGIGGMAGAAVGVGNQERKFSLLVKDATHNGYFVLVAHTASAEETATAREVIGLSVQQAPNVPNSGYMASDSTSSAENNAPSF